MVEPDDIARQLFCEQAPEVSGLLDGVNLLLTAGPTREPIDPVRYISNRSSGKMGFAMAAAAAAAGARVTLIAGPVNLQTPHGVERIDVQTASDMHSAALSRAANADIYIGAAAISDYRPKEAARQKVKKHAATLQLDMVKSADVLADIAALTSAPFTVGFAAETQNLDENARSKLVGKKLNMIIGNLVGDNLCFDRDENCVTVIWNDGAEQISSMPKKELAKKLIAIIAEHYRQRITAPTPIRQPSKP
jgi:phosphopantothenoylcysteine decarboxylase/phosphopantothenate--cysteine ligase